ncbi:MAG: hypothetical protein EOM10_13845, partial [Opitutae bacterium]|nr:hypothetical protein [Opitutae bacterium]
YEVSAGGISLVLKNLADVKPEAAECEKWVEKLLAPHCELLGIQTDKSKWMPAADYSLEGLNIQGDIPLERVVEAIRRFLNQAESAWAVPPMYICLAGDGHLDYHDNYDQAASRPNHIPPLQKRVPYDSSPSGTYITMGVDGPLADLDEDGRQDLAIGRLPAQSSAALERMITRMVTHESSHGWKTGVQTIADKDDEDDFAAAVARLRGRIPADISVSELVHTESQSVDTMRAQFIRALNSGPLLAVYYGHANNVGISSPYFFEHSHLRSDMSSLTNAVRAPVLVAGTCMLNNFALPHPDNRCLGKGFLDTAPGGPVAVWASASESTLGMSEVTTEAMFDELFATQGSMLGDMALAALEVQSASASPWTVLSSVLLGDPGMLVRTRTGPDGSLWTMMPGDLAVFQPSSGSWNFLSPEGARGAMAFGWSAVKPVPADYDGDRVTDVAVYHPASGNWYIRPSGGGSDYAEAFGWSAAIPLPGDYDGDGIADLAVFHQKTARWYFRMSSGGADSSV